MAELAVISSAELTATAEITESLYMEQILKY